MNLLLYTSGTDDASKQLVEMALTYAERGTAEIFHSLEHLTTRLAQPKRRFERLGRRWWDPPTAPAIFPRRR